MEKGREQGVESRLKFIADLSILAPEIRLIKHFPSRVGFCNLVL